MRYLYIRKVSGDERARHSGLKYFPRDCPFLSYFTFEAPLRKDPNWGFFVVIFQTKIIAALFYLPMYRHRKVAICPRVQVASGAKVVALVPVVMPSCTAQRMAVR